MGKRNPNGYGCVTKLKGNRSRPWVIKVTVYDEYGKSHQQPVGYAETKEAAMILLALKIKDPMYTGRETAGEGTLILWYTDDSLTEFLNDAAVSYRDETGVKVKPELVDGVDFLRKINHASVYEGEEEDGETIVAPDIYITTHDNLMKAYYAGLASEITDPGKVINPINYPDTSLHAIRCAGKYVGYPLYYETNFLLYAI